MKLTPREDGGPEWEDAGSGVRTDARLHGTLCSLGGGIAHGQSAKVVSSSGIGLDTG